MNTYHCYAPDGRYAGIVKAEEPRDGLTELVPPDAPNDYVPYFSNGSWALVYLPNEYDDAPPTLEDRKEAKWEKVKDARNGAEFGPFMFNGAEFDADEVSTRRITGAVTLALAATMTGQPYSIEWTLADNTVMTLDATGMIGLGLALGQHVAAQHAHARDVRAAIEAATTPEEVEGTGW